MSLAMQVSGGDGMPIPQSIKALLLDDSNFDRARIRRLSSRTDLPIQLDEVGSIEEMDNAVRASAYDLIMIDYRLPVGDGLAALDHIQLAPLNKEAGTIMITGDAGVETAVTAMRRGCHDFLSKDAMTVEQLKTAMMNAISAATQRRAMIMDMDAQREIIRQGLTAALLDEDVQGTVVSLVQRHLAQTPPDRPNLWVVPDPGDIDALLAGFLEDDEFQFH